MSFGLSAGAIAGIVGAGASVYSASKAGKGGPSTTQQQADPRITQLLLGNGDAGSSGLLQQWAQLGNNPMSSGQNAFGQTANNYLQNYSGADTEKVRNAAYGLMQGNSAPLSGSSQAGAGPAVNAYAQGKTDYIGGEKLNAPAQNNINLTGTFSNLLGGGDNKALMQSLQSGSALVNAQLAQNQGNLTQNLQRNVLPGIRSGAIASGQYGGSRQGIAEGNAISDFTRQLNDSSTQIGLANSANTAGQLANAYESGQNRSLVAAQGLSGQQYGAAAQNSAQQQQANLANMGASNDAQKFYAQQAQAASLANAQLGQSNNQFNASLGQNNNQFNAGQQQQTNNQNSASSLAGAGLLSGQLQQQNQNAGAWNNYGLTQAGQVSGILSPYAGVNGSSSTNNPYFTNTAGNALGGAAAGLGLYNQFKNLGNTGSNGGGTNWGSFGDLFGSGSGGTLGSSAVF